MWNEPTKQRLSRIPGLYETEHTPLQDKIIHLHFFIAGCDWYIAEWDCHDLFWGYAILNGDYQMAEWGYMSFRAFQKVKAGRLEVDNDRFWKKRTAAEVDKICKGMGWPKPKEVKDEEGNELSDKQGIVRSDAQSSAEQSCT